MRDHKASGMPLLPYLHDVTAGKNLTSDQAHQAMSVMLEGGVSDALVAGFLVALKMKGETADELAGCARAMREKCVHVDAGAGVIDIVGTGGDGANTFNISTVAAIIMAGAGARVAKHGNRAISGKVGSADVFEALGVRIAMTPEEAACAVREIGLGFLYAPHLHPAMKHVQPVRRELKMRTIFNLLGPLANPAGARRQLIGAPSVEIGRVMAQALRQLGTEHSYVVHGLSDRGHGGLDEVSSIGSTEVFEVTGEGIDALRWEPSDFGIPCGTLEQLTGGDASDNARITLEILRGERGAKRDIALINAAAGLMAGGMSSTHRESMVLASKSIDCGQALAVLKKLQKNFPVS
jgi:anthranilate phosphoribosyltransferase